MAPIYVAIDLETTGLDPEADSIIEIGAVRFQGDRVLEAWSSLVNPGVPIPPKIQRLTGITPRDVEGAPRLAAVLPRFLGVIRNHPLVGHNIAFDVSFLTRAGVTLSNLTIDTFELASIVLPKMASYNLEQLTRALGLSSPTYHRSLADALLAKDLFLSLYRRALDLDLDTLQEIARIGRRARWSLAGVFSDIARDKEQQGRPASIRDRLGARGGLEAGGLATSRLPSPLVPSPEKHPVDPDILAAILEPGGPFSRHFPAYEHRPQQIAMLRAVAEAFNNNEHLIVEAGTGVGKSLAYLIPALAFAQSNNQRVVISTNTITLQDQLIGKDIPDLLRVLQQQGVTRHSRSSPSASLAIDPDTIRVAVVKGRANYLCPRRFNAFRSSERLTVDDARLLAKVLVWLPITLTGDRAELTLASPAENAAWSRINADHKGCTADTCANLMHGTCFLYRTRKAAEAAHLIIANHALILSDIATDNAVLPDYRYLIIDEAHRLEDVATETFGYHVGQGDIMSVLDALSRPMAAGHTSGLLSTLDHHFQGSSAPERARQEILNRAATLVEQVGRLREQVGSFFATLSSFWQTFMAGNSNEHTSILPSAPAYEQSLRLTSAVRTQPAWSQVDIAWENVALATAAVVTDLQALLEHFTRLADANILNLEDLLGELTTAIAFLSDLREYGGRIISIPAANEIAWIALNPEHQDITLHSAPLHVGDVLGRRLFSQKDCVVLTSATLAADNSFIYVRERLGLDTAGELLLGSPFDYTSSTLLYLPTDLAEPGQPYYQKNVEQAIITLCRASGGRALILLTSHAAVRSTYYSISRALEHDGITVLGHGIDGSPRQIVERFKQTPRAVMLGTASLWEGVDVVGEALSVLVIARLPFAVPTDPIFAARSETFDDAFNRYAVPQAILKFKQGFGRLIRSKTDRGVVAILDQRILSRPYGQAFLRSLPPCTILRGPIADLPTAAQEWLAGGRPVAVGGGNAPVRPDSLEFSDDVGAAPSPEV